MTATRMSGEIYRQACASQSLRIKVQLPREGGDTALAEGFGIAKVEAICTFPAGETPDSLVHLNQCPFLPLVSPLSRLYLVPSANCPSPSCMLLPADIMTPVTEDTRSCVEHASGKETELPPNIPLQNVALYFRMLSNLACDASIFSLLIFQLKSTSAILWTELHGHLWT